MKTWKANEMSVINLSDPSQRCSPRSVGGLADDWSIHGTFAGEIFFFISVFPFFDLRNVLKMILSDYFINLK